jgi:ATP-binding cassette subfamily B protein
MKKKSNINNLMVMLKIAWQKNRFLIIYQLFFNTIRGPFPLLVAYINKLIVDRITNKLKLFQSGFSYLVVLVVITIMIQILYEFLMTLDTKLSIISVNNIFEKIQHIILKKIKDLDKEHFEKLSSKNIIYRGKNFNYEAIHNLIELLSNILRRFFTAIVAAIILVKYSYLLTGIIVVMYLPQILIGKITVDNNQKLTVELTEANRKKEYISSVLKSKKYLKEMRMFGGNDFFINKYNEIMKESYTLKRKYYFKNLFINGIADVVQLTVNGIIYTVLVINAYLGNITIGDINFIKSAFDDLSSELYSSISMMVDLYKDLTSFDFFYEFTNLKNNIEQYNKDLKQPIKNGGLHKIEFKNVYFSYPESNANILENVSFVIEKGESMGLIGANGSGKTTIIKLLLRMYDCNQGKILIDDIDIKEYSPFNYRLLWGVQYQDYNLFPMTIKENIALGVEKDNIDFHSLIRAAKKSDSFNFIRKLKLGFDSQLYRLFDSEGYEPSGGEAQKLVLARIFYAKFEMYILDEPSSAIDANAEDIIFRNLVKITQKKTSIFVTHRLSNVKFCNKILLIKDGKIIDIGTHEQLMDNEYYSSLYATQSNKFLIRNELFDDENKSLY